jgi:two-component system chemotaxis response regulator CheY
MAVEVMIVDDAEEFRYLLRRRLESCGCEVVAEAANAREGLDLFRAKRPRLVTLDLLMPDDPKFVPRDLFRQIRRESPQTAIVVMSVLRAHSNAPSFLREGALAYWEKSFLNFDNVRRRLADIFPELKPASPQNHSSLSRRIRGS